LREGGGDGVDCALGGRIDDSIWRIDGGNGGANVDDAAARGVEDLQRLTRGLEQAEHIDIEVAMEVLLGEAVDGREAVNTRIVDQDIDVTEGLFGFGEEAPDVRCGGDVALHGDGLAALSGDIGDDLICALAAGSIVDDHLGPGGSEVAGDLRSDALGR